MSLPASHAVVRSSELLSCAKTAIRIAKSRNSGVKGWWDVDPTMLSLCGRPLPVNHTLEDAFSLLRTMKLTLDELETLVRRSGHSNDPTAEISRNEQRFQSEFDSLTGLIQIVIPPSIQGGQKRLHWQSIRSWLQEAQRQKKARLDELLKIRSSVLTTQTERLKRLTPHAIPTRKAKIENNALFQKPASSLHQNGNGAAYSGSNYSYPQQHYAGSSAYGNGYGTSSNIGMRQRRNASGTSQMRQSQVVEYATSRQTAERLKEAQQAEQSLAQIGTMVGKMSSMLVQQSEVLETIEGDVEAAYTDVSAARDQISILHSIKKGNRPLILKVFALLNFLIVFMKFAVRK